MKILNLQQQSPEWFKARALRMTGSHATAIGNAGKGLDTYIDKKMTEYYSSAEKVNFKSKDMERGNKLEPLAATKYEFEKGGNIQKVGFVVYNDYVGCSPDRQVDEDGLLEIKCPNDYTYFHLLIDGKIDPEKIDPGYIWQMQMQMLICERDWCDYTVYNPNFEQSLFIERIYPDQKKFDKLKYGFDKGEEMIKTIMEKMNGL